MCSGNMSHNKLLTDTYKYVKRTHANKDIQKPTVKTDIQPPSSKTELQSPVFSDKEILRQFDMTLEFGPCIGITRLERWERAEKHGLNPSPEVKDIILSHKDNPKFTECVWNDYTI